MTQYRSYLSLFIFGVLLAALLLPVPAPAAPVLRDAADISVVPLDDAPFGLNTHLASRYPDPASMGKPADVIAQLGAGWAREDVQWWRVQPTPNTWDWTFTDAAFRALLSRNIKVVGVLGHPPGWATPFRGDAANGVSFYAPDQQQFVEFATTVVRRYGKYVHHWEIWNEPDHALFWLPTPDPETYADLLIATGAAIHAQSPDAKVILGGVNPFDTAFLRRVAERGAWSSFDILGIHPYVDPATPESGNIVAAADAVRAVADQYGDKPIWVTEFGWASGPGDRDTLGKTNAQQQADFLVRSTLLLWRSGVERVFWYMLKDDAHNPYGLVSYGNGRDDFDPARYKPAFFAFQTLSKQLSGATFVNMRDLFTRTTFMDFESPSVWWDVTDTPGSIGLTDTIAYAGRSSALLSYTFSSPGPESIAFTRARPTPIPGAPYGLGVWVYGDGSGNTLKVWLRDAEDEVLQYTLGTLGPAGWRLLQAPLGGSVPEWDRLSAGGNGKLDFPARLMGVAIDDAPDTFAGSGAIYLDNMVAISGPEAYDMELQRGSESLDVLWAPAGVRARLPTATSSATVTDERGTSTVVAATNNAVSLSLGSAPVFVQHTRP